MASVQPLQGPGFSDVVFEFVEGGPKVMTGVILYVPIFGVGAPTSEAGTLVEATVTLPRDARIQRALFELIAAPDESATIGSVATVRPSAGVDSALHAAATIDFGTLVTVGGIYVPDASQWSPVTFRTWTGTGWSQETVAGSFPDVATERLLVESSSSSNSAALAAALADEGGVALPVVPGSLELVVGGTTAWVQRQGSAALEVDSPTETPAGGARFVVDATDALRTAFQAAVGAGGDGVVTIPVTLRAATPGTLVITPQVNALRVHQHAFPPDGLARTFDRSEEGQFELDVSPPAAELGYEVSAVIRGSFGDERVQPPVGQPELDGATLVLAVGRTVLIGVPRLLTDPFATLSGLRMRLASAASGGGQVTGRLLAADANGRPAEPIKNGDVRAVSVADAVQRWYTLPFAAAVALPKGGPVVPPTNPPPEAGVACWLELQAGYGEVECGLTPDVEEATDPGGLLRRRRSGRGISALTLVPALGQARAALRVVGKPDEAMPAVVLEVAGAADSLALTPTSDNLTAVLTLSQPVAPPVLLRLTCTAPGSLTLSGVQVTYSEQEQP